MLFSKRCVVAVVFLFSTAVARPLQAAAPVVFTSLNSGDWGVAGTWNAVPPGDHAFPVDGDTAIVNHGVTLSGNQATDVLTLQNFATLGLGVHTLVVDSALSNWSSGNINGGTLDQRGTLALSTANAKTLTQSTLDNSGTLSLISTGNFQLTAGATLLNGSGMNSLALFDIASDADVTPAGGGMGNAPLINNSGTVRKSAGGGVTTISTDIINQNGGLIEALSGTLQLTGPTLTNTGGTVRANGGTVQFAGGINVIGGTLDRTGSSLFDLSTVSVTFTGPTNAGYIRTNPNTGTTLGAGSLINNGTWELGNNVSASPSLNITGDFTFSGTGELFLSDNNCQINTTGAAVLTNDVAHAIRGRGNINAPLVNSGDVRSHNGVLNIIRATTNHGTLTATVTGNLVVNNAPITNHGTVTAEDGAQVVVTGASARINGGTLQRTGTGEIRFQNSGGFSDVTNLGLIRIVPNHNAFMGGTTVQNLGTIEIGSTMGASPTLQITSDLTMNGAGDVFMSDSNSILSTAAGAKLTIGGGQDVHGRGNISAALDNAGIIRATTGPLMLSGNPKTNGGILRGEAGQTLTISQIPITNSGTIEAADGSLVDVAGGTAIVQGGTLQTTGSGVVRFFANAQFVDINNQGHLRVVSNHAAFAGGTGLQNDGTIEIGTNTGASPILTSNSHVTMSGSGDVFMSDSNASLATALGMTLTIPATQDIHGRGQIPGAVNNAGTVRATTGTLNLNTNPKTNTGTLSGESGQTLQVTATVNNVGGTIAAADASRVDVGGGGSVQGGTLQTAGSGVVQFHSNSQFTDINNQGLLRVLSNHNVFAGGAAIQNDGTIEIGASVGASPAITVNSDLTLNGTGDVFMSDTNSILTTAAGVKLTISATQDVHGRGQIPGAVDNAGTIRANIGPLSLHNLNNPKSNSGTMSGESGHTLQLNSPVQNTGGLIVARDMSLVQLNGGNAIVQGGTLDTEGSGVVLSTNGGIVDVTNDGLFRVQPNTTTSVGGTTLVNNGVIDIGQNVGAASTLFFATSVNVTGGGEFLLSDTNTILSSVQGVLPIFGPNLLIHGRANLTTSGLNLGSIVGDHPGQILIINPSVSPGLFNGGHIHVAGPQNMTINTATNFTNMGDVQIDVGRILTVNNGPYRTVGGNTMVAGTLQTGGVLLAGGILSGAGTVIGTVNNDGGAVAPGASAGTLSVTGAYAQSAAGELLIEIGGVNAGEFDKLAMTGVADLCGGTLVIDVINGFVPTPGQTFIVLTAPTLQGAFDSVVQDCSSGSLFNVTINANNVTLTALAGSCVNGIVSSIAPNGSIDARKATNLDGTGSFGPTSIALTFASAPGALVAADFAVTSSNGTAPTIFGMIPVVGNVATVTFGGVIPVNSWTTVRHIASNTAATIGFRPGDVNADGATNTVDPPTLSLGLGGHLLPALAQRSCDINRSTSCTSEDLVELMNLLNGADGFNPQLGVTHPTCSIP